MKQSLALEIMKSGENVLLTGAAGAGKTYVLNEFISQSKSVGKSVATTATTGLAATHLNGCTIHSWAAIGINDELKPNFFDFLPKSRIKSIVTADVLIIDEVSMLHDYRLDMIDTILRKVRGKDSPFGGIQIVLCGDFFQLPPINRGSSEQSHFVINSSSYQDLDPVVCYLEEQHRQDDEAYLGVLNAIRSGEVSKDHFDLLMSRLNAELSIGNDATALHTTNVDVDSMNSKRLKLIKEDEHHYEASVTGKANYVETLKRSCLALDDLVLKEGALVMCIKNNQERRFVNGSLGRVIGFDEENDYPIVKLLNNRVITVAPEVWELRDGDKKNAGLEQIPLRLAWAMTVHKSQGMTLDAARIDLRRSFVAGMGYVALSRIKNLDGLSLLGLNDLALKVSDEALEIDNQLASKSKRDVAKYSGLLNK